MKLQNRLLVYQYIQTKPGQKVTRTEASRTTGISGPTILKTFDFFEKCGIIQPDGARESGELGRRSNVFRFCPNAAHAVGVSYDGQTLELSMVNLNYETVLHSKELIQTDISNLIGKILPERVKDFNHRNNPLLGIGVSLPAVVDTHGRSIRYQAYSVLRTNLSREKLTEECDELEQKLGTRVLLENDVNCAAVAEYRAQEMDDHEDLIFIMLGGGLGAGLILNGQLRRGAHFACGEVGYMVVDSNFTIKGKETGYMEYELFQNVRDRFGIDLLKDSSRAFSTELRQHVAASLSLVIANLANSLDVSSFVLGGFVCDKLGAEFLDIINEKMRRMCLQEVTVTGSLCKDACANGAASLLIDMDIKRLLSDNLA
jgi:predicted NBD/HSP70 family sugar kinase